MNISKYINWAELWTNEICLQSSLDSMEDDIAKELEVVVKQFQSDSNVELNSEECFMREDGCLIFFFDETGGQNESDTQGWSREYCFIVDEDFLMIDGEYRQG